MTVHCLQSLYWLRKIPVLKSWWWWNIGLNFTVELVGTSKVIHMSRCCQQYQNLLKTLAQLNQQLKGHVLNAELRGSNEGWSLKSEFISYFSISQALKRIKPFFYDMWIFDVYEKLIKVIFMTFFIVMYWSFILCYNLSSKCVTMTSHFLWNIFQVIRDSSPSFCGRSAD